MKNTRDANLIAFSSILGGLLASGHYTRKTSGENECDLVRNDFGDDWSEIYADDVIVDRRFVSRALESAEELFNVAKAFCEAQTTNQTQP